MKSNNLLVIATILSLTISPVVAHAAQDDSSVTDKVKATGKQIATETMDATISTQVKALFALESDIKSFDIHVTTTDHVVHLSGNVDTQLQANKAVELAQSVKGVDDVDSDLSITSSNDFLKDAFTTARVNGKIMQLDNDHVISSKNALHVETTNGVVHIFGKVGKRKDISTIEQAVKKMKGVNDVKTDIDVMK